MNMEKSILLGRKILAFDFGDGETVASYFDGHNVKHCYFDREQRRQKLFSAVFRSGDQYNLLKGDKLVLNIKKSFIKSLLISKDKTSPHFLQSESDFKGFIKCAVDAVINFNSGINISECALLFSYPSSFYAKTKEQDEEMRSLYISLIESVLKEYKHKSIAAIDEAAACFYSKGDASKNCFIIDAGSSTLDFTLFVKGNRVGLPPVQNSTLGASCIEESLFEMFNKGEFSDNVKAIDKTFGLGFTRPYIVRALREKKESAYTNHQYKKLGSYELSNDVPSADFKYSTFVMSPLKGADGKLLDFNFTQEISVYRAAVHKAIVSAIEVANDHPMMRNKRIEQVVLCGGASLMEWLQDDVAKIFSDIPVSLKTTDGKDSENDPSYTVSDGLIRYVSKERYQIDTKCGFNRDGVLIIKKDGKFGAAEQDGKVLLECTYEYESNIPRRCPNPNCKSFNTSYAVGVGKKIGYAGKQAWRAVAAWGAGRAVFFVKPEMAGQAAMQVWKNLKPTKPCDYQCNSCGRSFD